MEDGKEAFKPNNPGSRIKTRGENRCGIRRRTRITEHVLVGLRRPSFPTMKSILSSFNYTLESPCEGRFAKQFIQMRNNFPLPNGQIHQGPDQPPEFLFLTPKMPLKSGPP